jgi:hypothetical protein
MNADWCQTRNFSTNAWQFLAPVRNWAAFDSNPSMCMMLLSHVHFHLPCPSKSLFRMSWAFYCTLGVVQWHAQFHRSIGKQHSDTPLISPKITWFFFLKHTNQPGDSPTLKPGKNEKKVLSPERVHATIGQKCAITQAMEIILQNDWISFKRHTEYL